jgi:hypothetical protein
VSFAVLAVEIIGDTGSLVDALVFLLGSQRCWHLKTSLSQVAEVDNEL